MKALAKVRPGPGLEIIEVPYPTPHHGEVVLKVKACGVCGSDAQLYNWQGPAPRLVEARLPYILGHEFAGEIVEVGPGVTGFRPGDRVAVEPELSCGHCYLCLSGRSNICPDGFNLSRARGMAEFSAVAVEQLNIIPDSLPYPEAALLEPLGVALHALTRMPVTPGNSVAVFGAGPIGLLMIQALKDVAHPLIAVGTARSSRRLDMAREFGADAVIVSGREDCWDRIAALTSGRGVDQAFEVAGTAKAVEDSLKVTRRGGQVCLVGTSGPVLIDTGVTRLREIDIFSSRGRTALGWERALRMVGAGSIRLAPLAGSRLPLAEAVRGFEQLLENRDIIKLIIEP